MADFEKNHPGIAEQELWKLFLRKAEEQGLDRDFISAVGEVCAIGLDLSKYIVRFFPTFTLHDETHSAKVCRWMWVLLGEQREQVTVHEASLLLMAACCHDIGMAVSPEQEAQMRLRTYPGWDDYFRQNLKDDEEYEETKVISDRILRNFVRMHHHERIGENLRESDWPDELLMEELDRDVLLKLCLSHGTELAGAELTCRGELYDLRLCAVLLRLADLLDFDAGRTPEVLFRQMGLDRPKDAESWRSAQEHLKNRTGKFREIFVNGCIPYVAAYDNPGVEQDIRKYLDWVDSELTNCRNCLSQSNRWKNLELPYKVDDRKVKRKGYAAGKFCMTMDQDKIIDLLTGENLYSDAGVFVRELLQNSIDAVLMRAKQDPNFSLEDGLIQIDTWMDEEANTWFRIRDNGTGMNEHIIQNHFLKVGNSYYTSEEFQYANRHAPTGGYTAISRFGIGILSCFMGDKEHTQLKVSTKRFGEGPNNGIRLDVTGLHGYYFLCNEKDHSENERWFPKMPSLNEEDRGYRTEPGTTICVNTNLLRMGELRTIREILDKYVQFPEVRVTYNGPEGYKEYPTQQELMEAVYALNPDGVVKEYVHEMPDAAFEKLKQDFNYHEWKDRPTISLWYEPLNWLSGSDNLTGVRIRVKAGNQQPKVQVNLEETLTQELMGRKARFTVGGMTETGVRIHGRLDSRDRGQADSWGIHSMENGTRVFLPFTGSESCLSKDEQRVWNMVDEAILNAGAKRATIAYHGVLACGENAFQDNRYVMLLRNQFLPNVNMGRDMITEFPLEAVCCCAMGGIPSKGSKALWKQATERELWAILKLDRYQSWREQLEKEKALPSDAKFPLWAAYWKQKGQMICENGMLYAEAGNPMAKETEDFPAGMFVQMKEATYLVSYALGKGVYNCSHPYSQWLIANRTLLVERVPALYDTVIRTMMWPMMRKGNPVETINSLNNALNALRKYPENPFNVPANLVLTEKDFED